MKGNLTEFSRNLGLCNYFFVTYYWKSPARGAHLYINVLTFSINVFLALFGSFANILIIFVCKKNHRVMSSSNMLLIALACSDVLVTALVQPLCSVRMLLEMIGSHDCLLWTLTRLTSSFSCGVSLFTVTVITVERFITLAYPYRHQTIITPIRVKVVVASTWLACLALVVCHLGIVPYYILLALSATLVLFSILTIIFVWMWIYRLLRRHRNIIETSQTPSGLGNKIWKRKQVFRNTRTSYFLVATLLLCYCPTFAMLVYFSTQQSNFVAIFLMTPWSETIMFSNSVLNPLLLLWRKPDFRNGARELLLQLKRGRIRPS